MTQEQANLIARIDEAIDRVSTFDTDLARESINRLRAKRDIVASGAYSIRDVSEVCISGVAGQIALLTRAYLT